MAVTINASTTTGLVQSADTSGIIELQNNGTTKLTVNSSGATIPTAIVTTLSDGTNSTSATNCIQGSARAWVNFNGTGTVAIRASGNVSSITDNGTGDYTVNFTTAMPDANYSTSMLTVNRSSGSATNQSSGLYSTTDTTAHTYTASAVRISTNKLGSTTGFNDADTILLSVFR